VDRDLTGHPAKLAERRVTAMRRLPDAVADVSAVAAWTSSLTSSRAERAGERGSVAAAARGGVDAAVAGR
jgi:hypothetical protein